MRQNLVPHEKKWLEIVMIDNARASIAVIPQQSTSGGFRMTIGMDNLTKQCCCCYRQSVYSMIRLVDQWICRSCQALCDSNKACQSMRRRWVSFSHLTGAWVHDNNKSIRLPVPNSRWGMELLDSFAKRDDMIAAMDASELIERHQKELDRVYSYNSWLEVKDMQLKAIHLLESIPQTCASDQDRWQHIGRACYAVSRDLSLHFKDWSCFKVQKNGKKSLFGSRTPAECVKLWHTFRPRTTGDSKEVLEARSLLEKLKDVKELSEAYKKIHNSMSRGKTLSFLDKDHKVLQLSTVSTGPEEHPEDLVDATIKPNDLIQFETNQQWFQVVAINLLAPGVVVKPCGGQETMMIGVAKLSGAWVQRPNIHLFQLPRESATWGLDELKCMAQETHDATTAREEMDLVESARLYPPELKVLAVDTDKICLGWINQAYLDQLDIDLNWEVQVEDGSGGILTTNYVSVYRGPQGGCVVQYLKPNTSYRFRLCAKGSDRCNYSWIKVTTLPGKSI